MELLIEHFELLTEAPENVKKLKPFFLKLASMGKLTEQLDEDSSVDDLLEKIDFERNGLVKQNKIDRFKSRFVVDGSKQEKGVDFEETFAPVVKYTTFRLFLALCAAKGYPIHHIDVKNAFINAPLDEEVYVRPHPEMKIPKGYCLKLEKSLYGLRQAPRNWNKHLHEFIMSLGFSRCHEDYCVYTTTVDGHEVLIAVFVDDIFIACAVVATLSFIIYTK